MTAAVISAFKDNNLWYQSPESVGKIIVGLEAHADMNGKAIYIEGGDGWEFEDSFYELQPQWLGEEPTRRMRMNAEAVNRVSESEYHDSEMLTVFSGSFGSEEINVR